MSRQVVDQEQRDRALDPRLSFLVQAPAGSGKTELLIQRYLALLPRVNQPEEILALTFTRKAAAEMRQRIHQALHRANRGEEAEEPHQRLTLDLARRALEQDRRMGWDLLAGSSRLQLQTIDSLCGSLVRQMPVLSQFGYHPQISRDPEELYLQAARNTLQELDTGQSWSESVSALVRHLDNDLERIARLISRMLGKRDQWLRHVARAGPAETDRQGMELALSRTVRETIEACRQAFPEQLRADVVRVAGYAGNNLAQLDPQSAIASLADNRDPFREETADLLPWLGLAELFLTKQGQWRKSASKNLGFPAPSQAKSAQEGQARTRGKEAFNSLLEELARYPRIKELLQEVRCLPETSYSEDQWSILQALLQILKLAAAQLQLVFRSAGEVDFQEIALRALQALGPPEDPTDLTLALDYRLSHILVDEFQDTSISQFSLLQRLTAGWQPGDGRTLFAVGDPMQSIYLFRDAEVGLFLRARDQGVGHIRPEFISLRVNFRSSPEVVDWVNRAFSRVMPSSPQEEEEVEGRVAYSPSRGLDSPDAGGGEEEGVTVHPLPEERDAAEADRVAEVAARERELRPASSTAILVRSRSHLRAILPRLRQQGLTYRAVEIETLQQRPVVSDLVSLTKALCHPGDRLSWLSLLRAPWCGLSLADLHALANEGQAASLLDALRDPGTAERLSPEGTRRLQRILPVLERAVEKRQRVTLRRRVEEAWLELGGPACAQKQRDLGEAESFLELLENVFPYQVSEFRALDREVERLFAPPDPEAGEGLQVMTVHRAKGLEFDTVILPGLDRAPPPEPHSLLLWQERPRPELGQELLMAPIVEQGQQQDSIYRHLKRLMSRKRDNELIRLMYVACTRARSRLHLLGRAVPDQNGGLHPPSRSLLACIWPGVEEDFLQAQGGAAQTGESAAAGSASEGVEIFIDSCRRLKEGWSPPPPPPQASAAKRLPLAGQDLDQEEPRFDWATETVRKAGVATHSLLQRICQQGWDPRDDPYLEDRILALLRYLAVPESERERTKELVRSALDNTLKSRVGSWILRNRASGSCEHPLSGLIRGRLISVVLDRTFLDEQERRWIIDYKAGSHLGSDSSAFLDGEMQRYRPQLERYAELMSRMEERPISLGLFFPLLQGWRQWDWS